MATNGENGAAPVAQEKINTDIVTLTRFLTEEQAKHKEATGDFTFVPFHLVTPTSRFQCFNASMLIPQS